MNRVLDLLVSGCATAVLSPVMIGIAVAVKLESPGPAIYTQTRVGQGGRPFRIFKFRSMVQDADQQGPYFTARGDSRITRVGAMLRKTSLDELPQLVNVLRGEMSLVGPRPDVPAQRSLYDETEWRDRHRVRPGLTGLAQATLRSDATPEQRKALDLQYANEHNLRLDVKVLLLTVRQVLGRGSY